MREINFISEGMLGDFIHCMAVVKNLCEKHNAVSNVYMTDKIGYGGDVWSKGCENSYKDLFSFIKSQYYVNKFELLPPDFNEPFINLNLWRNVVMSDYSKDGFYSRSWSEFLSSCYDYQINHTYKWMSVYKGDYYLSGKIGIHKSLHRHNPNFNWDFIVSNPDKNFVFITSSREEWDAFEFKPNNLELKLVSTIEEIASCISLCKFFIGNQSAPFAIASGLDIPRLCVLDNDACKFYMNEVNYSDNLSWFLNNDNKNINSYSPINF